MTPIRLSLVAALTCVALGVVGAQAPSHPSEYEFRERATPTGEAIKHVVYKPKGVQPGRRYPLVVYLHGSCGECVTHERILLESNLQFWHDYERNQQKEPTFLMAPAGGTGGWTSQPRRDTIFAIIDGLLEEFPIDRQRIYLTGFSMGANGTWNYLQHRPGFFAAANPQAIGGGMVDPELVKNTPIWATIGLDDNASRVEQLTANVAKIRAANGDPRGALDWETGVNPRFTIFPNTTHGEAQVRTQEIPGFAEWMYSQVNDGNVAPNVRFIRPVRLDAPYAAKLTALVSAVDPDGSIERVEFYLDDKQVSVDREAPYEHAFEGLPSGAHVLRAKAFDNGGKSRTTEVSITVK